MTSPRLFVALAAPGPVRRALAATMGGIAGARWQSDDQLHCTLRFLGEVDVRLADDVVVALAGVRHPAIEARLDGVGTFDREGRIDTLWVGIAPLDAMRALHAKVDRALMHAGIAADRRAYRPHVTVARFPRSMAPPPEVAAAVAAPPLAFRFDEFHLYESVLARDGARYETVERYRLD